MCVVVPYSTWGLRVRVSSFMARLHAGFEATAMAIREYPATNRGDDENDSHGDDDDTKDGDNGSDLIRLKRRLT